MLEGTCGLCECVILAIFFVFLFDYLLGVKYVHTMGTCKTVRNFSLITSVKSANMIPKIEFKSIWNELEGVLFQSRIYLESLCLERGKISVYK